MSRLHERDCLVALIGCIGTRQRRASGLYSHPFRISAGAKAWSKHENFSGRTRFELLEAESERIANVDTLQHPDHCQQPIQMPPPTNSSLVAAGLQSLRISLPASNPRPLIPVSTAQIPIKRIARPFSASSTRQTWLEPKLDRNFKTQKGRAPVRSGGSSRGTTVILGDWGLRMVDYHRRISAKQLRDAVEAIKNRLRGQKYRLFPRVACNHGVFTSGNEVRMGKGKGSFDHWSTRVALNQIVLELKGMVHEQVARDALRLAGQKLPGVYRFAMKGDPPIVGKVQLTDGVTLEMLKRPRKPVPLESKTSPTKPAIDASQTESAPPPS
ncbi:ribosomal protein L10e/L16 [Zalerion maritima]|uniref:Ribosomal protein L10e/L16 n=1 Tax=Zalerion maritima TaxID=339359 RepID=A0AAD5RHK7_9PEZI|nr:ribosomal protein L10e/L16 [Zalerion maritima]